VFQVTLTSCSGTPSTPTEAEALLRPCAEQRDGAFQECGQPPNFSGAAQFVILIAPLVLAGVRRLRARRHIDVDDTDRGAPPAEEAGELTNTGWSLAIALGMLAVFTVGWFVSAGFSPEARLVPQLLCTGGVIVALVLVALELKARRTTGDRRRRSAR
jgi:hypothetical protein